MGRHQKPLEAQILQGTARGDRPRSEPPPVTLEVAIPDPPDTLNARAQNLWIRVCNVLLAENRLSAGIQPMLEVYCNEMETYWHYAKKVRKDPTITYRDENGTQVKVVNTPLAAERDGAFNRALALAKEYGFTPASHSKLKGAAPPEKPKSRLQMLRK